MLDNKLTWEKVDKHFVAYPFKKLEWYGNDNLTKEMPAYVLQKVEDGYRVWFMPYGLSDTFWTGERGSIKQPIQTVISSTVNKSEAIKLCHEHYLNRFDAQIEKKTLTCYVVERLGHIGYCENYSMVIIAEDAKHAERKARCSDTDFEKAKLRVTPVDMTKEAVILTVNTGA